MPPASSKDEKRRSKRALQVSKKVSSRTGTRESGGDKAARKRSKTSKKTAKKTASDEGVSTRKLRSSPSAKRSTRSAPSKVRAKQAKTRSSKTVKPIKKKGAAGSTTKVSKITVDDLLSEADLDTKHFKPAVAKEMEIEIADDSDDILMPDDLSDGDVEIVISKKKRSRKAKKSSSGKVRGASKKAKDASGEASTRSKKNGSPPRKAPGHRSQKVSSKRSSVSRRRSGARAPQGDPNKIMKIASIVTGIMVIFLLAYLGYRWLNPLEATDHQRDLNEAKAHYQEAVKLVHDMRQASDEAKPELRDKAIAKLKTCMRVYQKLQEDPRYSVLDEGDRIFSEEFAGYEDDLRQISILYQDLNRSKGFD